MADRMKIVLYGEMVTPNLERLKTLFGLEADWTCVGDLVADSSQAAAVDAADAVVAVHFRYPVRQAGRLRLLQVQAAGTDHLDYSCLPDSTWVCNAYGHEQSTAEHAVASMLMWSHKLLATDRSFRAGSWAHSGYVNGPKHGELNGKTVGVLGLGQIGMAVVAKAAALGTRVIGCSRSLPSSGALDQFFPLDQIDEFLRRCDFVVICIAATPETYSLIDAARLACMQPHAYLVNIARGAVVAEDALYEALLHRRIAGAALDVWWQYPTAEQPGVRGSKFPFHALDNVLMTPHSSAWSGEMMERRLQTIAENLRSLHDGRPLRNVVRRPAGKS